MRVHPYNLPDPEENLLPPSSYWQETIEYDRCEQCMVEFPTSELNRYYPFLPHLTCEECMRIDKILVEQTEF